MEYSPKLISRIQNRLDLSPATFTLSPPWIQSVPKHAAHRMGTDFDKRVLTLESSNVDLSQSIMIYPSGTKTPKHS